MVGYHRTANFLDDFNDVLYMNQVDFSLNVPDPFHLTTKSNLKVAIRRMAEWFQELILESHEVEMPVGILWDLINDQTHQRQWHVGPPRVNKWLLRTGDAIVPQSEDPYMMWLDFRANTEFPPQPRYSIYGTLWTTWDWHRFSIQRRVNTERMFTAELGQLITGFQTGHTVTILPPDTPPEPQAPLSQISIDYRNERWNDVANGNDMVDIETFNIMVFRFNVALPGYASDYELDMYYMERTLNEIRVEKGFPIYAWDSLPEESDDDAKNEEKESSEIFYFSDEDDDDESSDDDDAESALSEGRNEDEEEPNGDDVKEDISDGNIDSDEESEEIDDLCVIGNRIVQTPHFMMAEHERKRREQEDDYTIVTDREDWD